MNGPSLKPGGLWGGWRVRWNGASLPACGSAGDGGLKEHKVQGMDSRTEGDMGVTSRAGWSEPEHRSSHPGKRVLVPVAPLGPGRCCLLVALGTRGVQGSWFWVVLPRFGWGAVQEAPAGPSPPRSPQQLRGSKGFHSTRASPGSTLQRSLVVSD